MSKYSVKLFKPPAEALYSVIRYKSNDDWKQGRQNGIGGSDASTVLGRNPWKTNIQLYREKVGLAEAPDISNKEAVKYGHAAEEAIRQLFKLDHPEFIVNYSPNTILQNKEYPFLQYSPDGLIEEKKTGRKGILEIKTTTIVQSMQKEKWKDTIPENYLYQCLQGMVVTGFDFVILRAQLKYSSGYLITKEYLIESEVFQAEMEVQKTQLIEFWNENILARKEPAMILPELMFPNF